MLPRRLFLATDDSSVPKEISAKFPEYELIYDPDVVDRAKPSTLDKIKKSDTHWYAASNGTTIKVRDQGGSGEGIRGGEGIRFDSSAETKLFAKKNSSSSEVWRHLYSQWPECKSLKQEKKNKIIVM